MLRSKDPKIFYRCRTGPNPAHCGQSVWIVCPCVEDALSSLTAGPPSYTCHSGVWLIKCRTPLRPTAVELTGTEFAEMVDNVVRSWWPGRSYVQVGGTLGARNMRDQAGGSCSLCP